ncbi:MAG: RNA polymerase sigma-70 factor [Muribaculaceae bacterium]|nr:RNA polymerase sigma-70 factor [Muribaculaceae bacterium]
MDICGHIEAFVQGDLAAFRQIYDTYVGKVFNFVLTMTSDEELARDVTQNTFVRLWDVREQIDATRPIAPFIYTIARNFLLKELRSAAIALRFVQSAASSQPDRYEMTVEADLTHQAIEQRILALLAELPEKRRLIFMMRWRDGMTNKEVAEALHISNKTVSTQIHRTVSFLREKLGLLSLMLAIVPDWWQ